MAASRAMTAALLALLPGPLIAQTWNGAETLTLVERGIARRNARLADTSLRDFRVQAHGFVFFLGQLAEGMQEPPRLIKSDELVLEVYWKAPDRSKQRIVGWRDRVDLPTDIQYHRDHLGIVQNNFGDRIRLGEGDEVRDVPHPLAPYGPEQYDYALVDSSLTIVLPTRSVRVYEMLVRPKRFEEPRVIGTLYFDVETAEVVIFRFSFTRSAYLDDTLEDITIVLENGLWDERYWLPRRQEIEIRRRTKWLDLPARGIIRGRWEIGDYTFNLGLPDRLFGGSEIVAAPRAVRDTFAWNQPLHAAIRDVAGPVMTFDLEEVRGHIGELAGAQALSGLAAARPSVGSVSDLVHFNRVEGLALGGGWVFRPDGGPTEIQVWASYGVSDERVKARARASHRAGALTLHAAAGREIADVGDEPVIAPVLNSLSAQELGKDYGDYYLLEFASAGVRRGFGARGGVSLTAAVERTTSVAVRATPARDTFRLNPALGSGTWGVGRVTLERSSPALALRGGVSATVVLEGGLGAERRYLRLWGVGHGHAALGATRLVTRVSAGWGSVELPPHRSFVLGGRGSLVGEPFRAWGGRAMALGSIEWQLPIGTPELSLGPGVGTGRRTVLAPFLGAGWASGRLDGVGWQPSDGVRPVAGLALEWFHGFFRAEAGVSVRTGEVGVVVDVRRDLWGIL